MPAGRIYKVKAKRSRIYRKKKKLSRREAGLIKLGRGILSAGIPDQMTHTFKYSENIQLNVGASGSPAVHVWHPNNLYDPSGITSSSTSSQANHQPMDYDLFLGTTTQFYNRYKVLKCYYKLTIINTSSNPVRLVLKSLPHTETPTTSSDMDAMIEQGAQYRILSGSGGTKANTYFKGVIDHKKLEGVRYLDDTSFSAVSSGPPTFQNYLALYNQTIESAEDAPSVYCQIVLSFVTQLRDRNVNDVLN